MSGNRFLRLLLRPEIRLHGDAEKKASLCHPCRQPSAPACGVPRRRNGSRAQRRQREVRRECRNEDFSGCCFARKYNCMGTPKKSLPFVTRVASRAHPLAGCRGAATEAARSAGKGRFGGNVETRISPAVVSPGNTTAWGRRKKASLCHPCRQLSAPACGVPRRRNGSRAQRRQREVRRECRNEDFSGCYFARKYNCMGTPEKSHCSRILFSKKRR